MSENNTEPESVKIKQFEDQLSVARREIHNLRQQVKSLNHFHRKEIDEITKRLENWRCLHCINQQPEQANSPESGVLTLKPIGVINTNFPEKRGTPRQPRICEQLTAKLTLNNDVFTNPEHALEGLQEFSHMWILFHFDRNEATHVRAKVAPPRLNGIRTGVFATRSPHRPNPIGLSLVKIERIVANVIYFSGVDMVDQTPVIDLKPFIPQYDSPRFGNAGRGEQSAPSTSQAMRVMDGEENNGGSVLESASNAVATPLTDLLRMQTRMGEREAPDGEEEEITPSAQNAVSIPTTPEGHIRIPPWIDQPPVATLTVSFTDRALTQLLLLGNEGEQKKQIITNVLREDPRSVYLRQRWSGHCYVFRIAELCVSCKFNDETRTVVVYQVFQNDVPECDE